MHESNGSVDAMEGLYADLSRNGYRLPTEAEWVYSSRGSLTSMFSWGNDTATSTAGEYSWFSQNSGSQKHPVKTKKANANGLYDMEGGLLEMVWGWLGALPVDTLPNYAGIQNPAMPAPIIVKGGSYLQGIYSMRNSARTDVYPLYASSVTSYMGFRIARGPIDSAQFTDPSGDISEGTPARIVASRDQIRNFFGTCKVRLAFVNGTNGHLATIDFLSQTPFVNENKDAISIANPAISPDGRLIAFGTRYEGQQGTSDIYLRPFASPTPKQLLSRNGAIPHWWIDPSNSDTLLIVAESPASNGDSNSWANQYTWAYHSKDSTTTLFSAPGSFHGGLSTDGQWLASGYTRLRTWNTQNNTGSTLFQYPDNGKSASGSDQVCNVSIRPGPSPDLMFLDFGYGDTSSLTGFPYNVHQVLFFANPSTGTIHHNMKAPKAFAAWDQPRWSNSADFFTASVVDVNDAHKVIFAVKYPGGDTLRLLEGDDMLMPDLWIDSLTSALKLGAFEDSLGRYETPPEIPMLVFHKKMHIYWREQDSIDTFIFGTSREMDGIIPSHLQGFNAINLAHPFAGPFAGIQISKDYLLDHSKKPKLIILGIGPEFSANAGMGLFDASVGRTLGYQFDRSHNFYKDSMPSFIHRTMLETGVSVQPTVYLQMDNRGYAEFPCNGWGGNNPTIVYEYPWTGGASDWNVGYKTITDFVAQATAQGVKVAAVILPMSPAYRNMDYYARHGGLRSEILIYLDSLQALAKRNPDFRFIDLHHDGLHDFTNSEAYDEDHLCIQGAIRASDSISARLSDWR